jgi:hypothetical protein
MSERIPVLKEPVLPVYVQFSRDKYIMEGPPEKLRKELEDELKLGSEEPRSHAWYHGAIPRQVIKKTHKTQSLSLEGQLSCLFAMPVLESNDLA